MALVTSWTQIGGQELRIEPELVFIRLHGTFPLADAEALIAILDGLQAQRGRHYLLFDASSLKGMEQASRRRFITWFSASPPLAIANFGGGVMQRTLAFLLYNALRLVAKHVPPQTYVATEEEARAWLAEQRRAVSSGKAGK